MNRMSENNSELQSLVETLEKKYFQDDKGPRPPNMAMVIKLAKVATWTKDTSLETFRRQIENWMTNSMDVPENTQFQDLVESFKHNKDIKGLAKYVGEHILTTVNTVEKQKVKVIDCLEIRYGQTRLEKLEELLTGYVKFREDDYDDEDDLLQVMLEFQRRKEELKIGDKEWHAVWMLI